MIGQKKSSLGCHLKPVSLIQAIFLSEFKKFYSGLFWIWNISPKFITTIDFWKWKEPVQWGSSYREQTSGLFFWL